MARRKPEIDGLIFIIAAPSGAGKSTLVNAVLGDDQQLRLSISFTTRPPRPGEEDGRDYHFVDRDRFLALQAGGEFLEHAPTAPPASATVPKTTCAIHARRTVRKPCRSRAG